MEFIIPIKSLWATFIHNASDYIIVPPSEHTQNYGVITDPESRYKNIQPKTSTVEQFAFMGFIATV